ncbi:MAG: trehalose-6-phosphate synthase [Parachlamydiaceae bacterium]
MNDVKQRLIIISNRLPFVVEKEEGDLFLKPGSGGLTTALAPVLRDRGGVWVGWTGTEDGDDKEVVELCKTSQKQEGYQFSPVFLTKEEISLYYEGFSNEIIWPLFHDLQTKCHFVPEYWEAYQKVNRKFAENVKENSQAGDFIWVHDYHLMLLGQELRVMGVQTKIGFFLHIPFPPLDIFLKLPWRFQIINALLQYDLIGFQTMRDRRNFVQCVRTLIKDARLTSTRSVQLCKIEQREVRIGAFPISIDYNEFETMSDSKEVESSVKSLKESNQNQMLVFSVDRLDYTKGIMYRLEAIRRFLLQHAEFHKKVQFIQLVVPSRAEILKYHELKEEINRLVGEINSQFTHEGWVPIHHIYRSFDRRELIAHYRASDAMLVTPVKDGMNLVAKEYIASNVDERGVLILSEFAGAAAELYKDAILINPYDILGVADAIHKALVMPEKERVKRMHRMRREVRNANIFGWVENYLSTAISKVLKDFPNINEYVPSE